MLTNERIAELIADYTHGRCVDPWAFARAVEAEARREALEEAAKVCEQKVFSYANPMLLNGEQCAAAIRALKEKE